MKNKLLALTLALLMLVTAIPAGAIGMVGVESADEVGTIAETAEAEVLAVKTDGVYKPGLNFLTGTTNAETFSDYTVTDYYGEAGAGFPADSTFISTNRPTKVTESDGNKYVEMSFNGADWTSGSISAKASDINFNRPAYLYFWSYQNRNFLPILRYWGTAGATQGASNTLRDTSLPLKGTNGDWQIFESNTPTIVHGIDEWNNPDEAQIFWIAYIHTATNAIVRYDNLAFVPYYKVTYKNIAKDGTTGADTVKYFLSDNISVDTTTGAINGLPSHYTVDTSMTFEDVPGFTFEGWSTTEGATEAMAEVTLANEDIVLYPVWKEIVVESDPIKTTGEFKPGLNFLTGTTNAETFNSFTVTEDYGTGVFPANSDSIIKSRNASHSIRVTSDGAGNNYAELSFAGGSWTSGGIIADADNANFGRPAYMYLMTKNVGGYYGFMVSGRGYMDVVPGSSNYFNQYPNSIVNLTNAGNGWNYYESNDSNVGFGFNEWTTPNQARIFNVNYQDSTNVAGTDKTSVLWDNLVFVPYYKVTYTGTDTVKYFLSDDVSVNVATGEITGLPTSYTVDTSITLEAQNGFEFVGWSTTNGATEAMTEVALENEDIVLYPVYAQTKEYSFVSAEGDYTFYTVEATPENFTFPTAEDLGVAYEPRFSDGTGIYYSGMSYAGDATEFEVYNSYVIYAENFDDEIAGDDAINITFDYTNWTSTTFGLNYRVGEYNGGKAACKTFTDFAGDQWPGTAFASSLGLNKPGIYTFKFDIAVTGASIPTTEIYFATENVNTTGNLEMVILNSSNTTRSVEFSAKLYRNDNNLWEMEMLTGTYAGQTREFKFTPDSLRINYHNYSALSDVTYYFDNFTVEYVPYAPTAVEKTSFRSGTPSGIRFASYVADDQKNQASCYGYVVAAKATLGYESNLTLDGVTVTTDGKTFNGTNTNGVKVVGAVAYNGDNIDRVFATNGSVFGDEYRGIYDTFFTGVLMGIDPNDAVQTSTVFVARPFIKIGDTYYYGDCYEASYNSVVNAAE